MRLPALSLIVLLLATAATTPTPCAAREPVTLETGAVPSGDIFEPLWGDPLWPMFRFSYDRYVDDDFLQNVVTFGIGDMVPFVRTKEVFDGRLDYVEFGGQGGVFSVFDQDKPSRDQFYTDFFGGVYVAGREGPVSGMVRAYHRSSHIGDEFLEANEDISRENFGFERFDLYLSYDALGTFAEDGGPYLRVYGGTGFTPSVPNPREWGRWFLQWGVEARSPRQYWDFVRPVAAVNVTQQEGNDFKPDVSVRAGISIDRPGVPGRALRFLATYYNGKENNGQFWQDDLQTFGFGIFINM